MVVIVVVNDRAVAIDLFNNRELVTHLDIRANRRLITARSWLRHAGRPRWAGAARSRFSGTAGSR